MSKLPEKNINQSTEKKKKKKEPDYMKPRFFSLSVKDLLEAREDFHFHLSNLKNVVGTAIGLYRIRNEDPDIDRPEKKTDRKEEAPVRTLANSAVKDWSWPCIMVFVSEWQTIKEIEGEQKHDDVIPKFVYMPDGRRIPLCVVKAEKNLAGDPPLQNFTLPNQLMGGGYPIFSDVQGQQHIGSLGCLVTDGDRVYGLTNRHVVGEKIASEPGRKIYSFVSGKPEKQEIGISSNKQIGKKLLKDVYKGWHGSSSVSVIDAGLIELTELNEWTAQVYGIGEIGEPVDLNTGNITLNLIGCPVRAFGGGSGEMKGQIQALFYRYKSLGGYDYVADLLIGPRDKKTPLMTREGDSGTIWFFDVESTSEEDVQDKGQRARRFRPVALQWGGQKLITGNEEEEFSFALATNLSTICRELDIDILRSWNIGYGEYWGKLGHYKIGAKACDLIPDGNLKTLMSKNLDKIAFDDQKIRDGEFKRIDEEKFVPLADVPDLAWGLWAPRMGRRGKNDSDNHFADMDEKGGIPFEDTTLLELTKDSKNIDVDIWNKFYDSVNKKRRGALPFRIWHVYKEMVKFLKQKNIPAFVCSAGILAHYVGDACNPLHASQYYDGRIPEENGVHSAYETKMLETCAAEIIKEVNEYLEHTTATEIIEGGHGAAEFAIQLIRNNLETLPPIKLGEAYVASELNGRHYSKKMFEHLINDSTVGKRTAVCIGEGCLTLASLWRSAWIEGNGQAISDNEISEIEIQRDTLKALYDDKEFLKSLKLNDPEFKLLLVDST